MKFDTACLILIVCFFAIALVVGIFLNSIGRDVELVVFMTIAGGSIIAVFRYRQKKLRASAY